MTGEKILTLALTRLGQKYVLGAFAPKNQAHYNGPWDCAEFCAWLVYQISARLYGCENNNAPAGEARADAYTGCFNRDAHKLGIIITPEEAARTPGAFLLRIAANGVTGHIVVSDGEGGTAEAHSTARGVITSVVAGRRWDIGILIPWITYTPKKKISVAQPKAIVYRFTKPMMQGPAVVAIQKTLAAYGLLPGAGATDGFFGAKTFEAVRSYQKARGLTPDGEVGPVTAKQMGITL
jgi:N-acetylmuramoyl-L-alanine amidase